MSDAEIIKSIQRLIARWELSVEEVAALAGCSCPTALLVKRGARAPSDRRSRRGFVEFIKRSEGAKSRSDLRLPS